MTAGYGRDLADLHRIVTRSFDLKTYEPTRTAKQEQAAERFAALCHQQRLLCTSRSKLLTAWSQADPTGTSCCRQ